MQDSADKQGLLARRVPLKWVIATVSVLVAIMVVIVVVVLAVDRTEDSAKRDAAATSTSEVTSPYDLTELPAGTDLAVIEDAAFVSIYVPNEKGTLTSYGVSSDLPAAQALSQSIREAEEADAGAAAAVTGATTGGLEATPSITFVLPTRETLAFILDLDLGLIVRGEQAWRPQGDLRALVEAAIAGPR